LLDTVVRARGGDAGAFEELVRAYEPLVRRLAWRATFSPDLAQDITQEVFLQVWRHLPELRNPGSFVPWLYRVAGTTCIRVVKSTPQYGGHAGTGGARSGGARSGDPRARAYGVPDPETEVLSREQVAAIGEEISRLPVHYRVAFSLYLEGLSYESIGRTLGIPVRTVETRLRRARQQLQARLMARESGDGK